MLLALWELSSECNLRPLLRNMKLPRVMDMDTNFRKFFLLAFSLLFIVPLFLNSVFVSTDLGLFYLPLYKIYSNSLQGGGTIPFWYSDIFNGFYLHAEGQLGMLHPVNYLSFRFLPFIAAFNLTRILPFFAAFYGMVLFCGLHDDLRPAKYFTSLLFAFNTFFLNHFVHTNMIFSLAHLPFLLYFSSKIGWRPGSLKYLVFSSLSWGSIFLLGHPQSAMIVFIISCIYSMIVLGKGWLGLLTCTIPSFFMGICISAVQILPTVDLFLSSTRHSPVSGFATTWSLHPANLIQTGFPFLFNQFYLEYGTYLTILVLALAAYSLKHKFYNRSGRLLLFALVILTAGLVLSFGKYFYMGWLLDRMPFFRVPARWYFYTVFGAVLLAGAGWKHILESDHVSEMLKIYRFLLGIALLLAAFVYIFNNISQVIPLTSYWMLSLFFFVPILAYSGKQQKVFIKLCLVVFVFELLAYGVHTGNFELRKVGEFAKTGSGEELLSRAAVKGQKVETSDNRMTLSGLRISKGYAGLMPDSKGAGDVLPGVNWRFIPRQGWVMVRRAVEYAWSIKPSGHLNSIPDSMLHFRRFSNDNVEFDAVLPRDAKLLLDITFHGGWKAWVDGAPQPVEKWGNGLLAINVPAGRSRCEVKFVPDSLRFGAVITSVFLFLAFLLLAIDFAPGILK